MADVRIDDAIEDLEATGVENIPVSDGGVGKRLPVERIKEYVVAAVTNAATTSTVGISVDGVYIRQGNELKRVGADVFGDAVMAAAFAKVGIVSTGGNEIFAISDAGTKKTITLSAVRSFVLSDVSDIFINTTTADAMASTDCFVVKQGSSVKKATALQIATYIESRIGSYVNALSDVGTLATTDKLLVSVNGVARSATVSELVALVQGGFVTGPSSTTENKVPQWDSVTKKLKDGLSLRTTVRTVGTADNAGVPTEAAVRSAIDSLPLGVQVSGATPNVGNIPVWAGSNSVSDGKSVQTSVRSTGIASDGAIPTELAVRTAIETSLSGKVDSVVGKGLSTNDYTNTDKAKLDGIDMSTKVDKITGKGLSTNDYTTVEKTKLAGIATGAEVNVQSDWNETDTSDPSYIKNKPTIPSASSIYDWSSSKTYSVGDYCLHGGYLQRCVYAGQSSTFRSSDWEHIPTYPTTQATEKFLRGDGTWNSIDLSGKVDKVTGKGLSTNDYTTAEQTKLAGIAMGADVSPITSVKVDGVALVPTNKAVNIDLSGKVDKVTGKGLSTNDYTTAEQTKLAGIDMSTKVDKVTGKGLSTNDYTTAEQTKLAGIAMGADVSPITSVKVDGVALVPTNKAVNIDLSGKVDKVTGKGLSTNDFTDIDKAKVDDIIADWSSTTIYSVGDYCFHGGYLQRCVYAGQSSTFRSSDWEYVPAYPSSGKTSKFLRGDGTWSNLPNDVEFSGATSSAAGRRGIVPAPAIADIGKYLAATGGWSDPVSGCAKAPSETTENKIPQWDSTSKTLKDGVVLVKSTDVIAAGTDNDTLVPTVAKAATQIADAMTSVVTITDTPTAGMIPVWMTPASGGTQEKRLVNGKSVITVFGETPSDANIPTEKAIADVAPLISSFVKCAELTITSGGSKTLVNHAVNMFVIATGSSYTLSFPQEIDGHSREFYVVFKQSGTLNATSTVNLSCDVEIHSRDGVVEELEVKKDVSGGSSAYHVYHFIEDDDQIWCVNIFDAAEGGGSVEENLELVTPTEDGTIDVSKGTTYRINGVGKSAFTINFESASSSSKVYYAEVFMISGSTVPTVSFEIDDEEATLLLPDGSASFSSLLDAGKATTLRFCICGDQLVVAKTGTYTIPA